MVDTSFSDLTVTVSSLTELSLVIVLSPSDSISTLSSLLATIVDVSRDEIIVSLSSVSDSADVTSLSPASSISEVTEVISSLS
jgi:hypothetical protein